MKVLIENSPDIAHFNVFHKNQQKFVMVPTRIRFLIIPLLSAWHCSQKSDSSLGWTNAPNRLFPKGVARSPPPPPPPRPPPSLFLPPLLSDLLCLRSSKSKYNVPTIHCLFFVFVFLLHYDLKDPSKHAGSDPEAAFWLRPLWPLRPACSRNLPGSYMPVPTSRIRFGSFFPRKAWIALHKMDPDLIWMVWSGFGQTHLVWKQAGVQGSSGLVSDRTQPSRYQFPTFRLGSVLPQTSRIILCKTSPGPV